MNASCNRDGHLKMLKRRKEEKEMGGANKIRMKKKKMLAREAANKCAKLTDLFREKGAVAGAVKVSDGEGQVEDDPCSHIDDEGEKEEEQEEGEQQEKKEQEEKNGTSRNPSTKIPTKFDRFTAYVTTHTTPTSSDPDVSAQLAFDCRLYVFVKGRTKTHMEEGNVVRDSHGHGIPIAYIILGNEKQATLQLALEKLKPTFPVAPRCFMVDKDQAEINAIRKVFNESHVLLCWYHVTQAVTRWLSRSESGVSGPENADSRAHIMQLMSELKSCSTEHEFKKKAETFHCQFKNLKDVCKNMGTVYFKESSKKEKKTSAAVGPKRWVAKSSSDSGPRFPIEGTQHCVDKIDSLGTLPKRAPLKYE
ncbi:hypothetical protein F2P79_009199 [Pimephales promelas]|nr:hypothetical protein F2P79_009199 [Pimephales promelas]